MKKALVLVVGLGLVVSLAVAAAAAEKERKGIPPGARGFAGMIRGKVVSAANGQLVLAVTQVKKIWKHSTAKEPQSLVGRTVLVVPNPKGPENIARFINGLEAGQEVTVDVRHLQPKALTLMELTKEQREKVK